MDQYNLFELGIILLFGLAGGLLISGRRGLLPDREARARGVFLAGGLLCAAVCVVLFIVETYPLLRELLF